MNRFRMGMRASVLAGLVVAGCAVGGWTARAQSQNGRPSQPTMPDLQEEPRGPRISAEMRERMEKARNDERQKRLIADTEKLYALATLLKEDVAKTDKYTLSLDVIHRTEEIEKLSRSIRERMKN